MNLPGNYTTGVVTSKDGTKIGYRQLGTGPGLLLVHGGMMTSQNFMKLGEALSDKFTVYIPDRRGRGLSGPHGNYSLMAEAGDMQALIEKTKAQNLFGLSSGAIVTLQTAIIEPSVKKIALFEPPIPVNGANITGWVKEYEKWLKKGNYGRAFIQIVKGTSDSSLLTILPGFITAPFMNFVIKAQAKSIKDDEVALKALIPTLHYDVITVHSSTGIIEQAKNMNAEILLIGGTKSQQYLKDALSELKAVLPEAKRVELQGLGHLAADNSEKPELVAKELLNFFGE